MSLPPILETPLLSCLPQGTQIVSAKPFRPDYRTFPMRVSLRYPDGCSRDCVVKINKDEVVVREMHALRTLALLGLPVPELLSDSVPLPSEMGLSFFVMSELPGYPLPWCGVASLHEADLTCRLVLEAVAQLHQMTDRVLAVETKEPTLLFPRKTLQTEFDAVVGNAGDWMRLNPVQRALRVICA